MARPTNPRKPRSKPPRPAQPGQPNGIAGEDAPVTTALVEPVPSDQIPSEPAEQAPRDERPEPKPRPEEDRGRSDGKGNDAKGKDNKDRVAANSINIAKLQAMSMAELNHMAKDLGVENYGTMRKHEVIFHILQKNAERSGVLFSEGVLEVLPEGFGFLRSQSFNYLPCPEDIYVSPSQI